MPAKDVAWYHGTGGRDVALEDEDGCYLGPLPHVARHSPTGFSWGYNGSGPADLAVSLLVDAVGPAAVCTTCAGTNLVTYLRDAEDVTSPYDPAMPLEELEDRGLAVSRCGEAGCDEGITILPSACQRFKEQFVAGWPGEWRMHRTEIVNWYAVEQEG